MVFFSTMEGSIENIIDSLKNPKGPDLIEELELGPRIFSIYQLFFRWIHIPIWYQENLNFLNCSIKVKNSMK